MFEHLSYLLLMLIFAGTPVLLELIFGFFYLKRYFKAILKLAIFMVFVTPFYEKIAFLLKAWDYNPQKHIGLYIYSSPLETLIFSLLITLAVAFPLYMWSFYEDNGKPILKTSIKDVSNNTYSIWRKRK